MSLTLIIAKGWGSKSVLLVLVSPKTRGYIFIGYLNIEP
jgi:hypothetical protein